MWFRFAALHSPSPFDPRRMPTAEQKNLVRGSLELKNLDLFDNYARTVKKAIGWD